MNPTVAVWNGTIAIWLKETLILANIRASRESSRKADTTMQPAREPQLGQSWKQVTGLLLP